MKNISIKHFIVVDIDEVIGNSDEEKIKELLPNFANLTNKEGEYLMLLTKPL